MTDYEKLIYIFENTMKVIIVNRHNDYFEVISDNGTNPVCFQFYRDGKLKDVYS